MNTVPIGTRQVRRRTVLGSASLVGLGIVAGCLGLSDDGVWGEDSSYEIWALDQGTDIGYIYHPNGDGEFTEIATIDFASQIDIDSHKHDHDHDHVLGEPEAHVEVSLETDLDGTPHFIPHVIHIEEGGTVEWTLQSGAHDTIAYHPETYRTQLRIPTDAEPWASDLLSTEGDTFTHTFDVEGVYDYVCTPHEDAGMVGTVVVGWPSTSDQPGLQPPSQDFPGGAVDQFERYNEQVRELLEAGEDYEPDHDHTHDDLAPHMIDFSADFEYAVVALHHGDGIAVVRTEDRTIVATVPTGHHSHFAAFAPDDEYITVDHVDGNRIVKVAADLATEEFEIVDEIVLTEEAGEQFEGRDPTCHYYTGTGFTYHTLGPSYDDAGLAVIDHEHFELIAAYTAEEVAANCGVFPHPEEDVVYLTAGLPSNPDEGEEGVGEYFVMDANTHEILHNDDTRGIDAHGLSMTPDGEELWITNRETNDGVIIDTNTHEIIEGIEHFGPETGESPASSDAPDILAASPDGKYMFATARGPNPVTADPQSATGVTAGFFVIGVGSRRHLRTLRPDPDNLNSDFHGIGVRPLE